MPKYIIKNIETGKYVSRSGSEHSYTAKLQDARTFPTREAAQTECCGNERVTTPEQEMQS